MNLDNVTLCSIDCLYQGLSISALEKSSSQINFNKCILFSDTQYEHQYIKTVKIDKLSHMDDYDRFIFKELHKHIDTDYLLIVQWDGWIIDKDSWDDRYLDYDYIGAPWSFYDDGKVVGNGGFSLRSKKLLNALTDNKFKIVHNQAEDDAICRGYRDDLEKDYNIKFAPLSLARKFSYESCTPSQSTFGFHGAYNLWRHTTDSEIINIFETLKNASKDKLTQESYFSLLVSYFQLQKYAVLKQLYNIMKSMFDVNYIGDGIFQVTKNTELTFRFIQLCENG